MKALIFNSGIGKRMGELTKHSPKCMVKLKNGETIFERQLRLLNDVGIKDVIITTGPYEEQLKEVASKKAYQDMHFTFVHNDKYDQTNYIYSFYLAKEFLDDDFLMLHGDLVFNKKLLLAIVNDPHQSTCLINKKIPLPEKDFKGRIVENKLKEVSIHIFDDNCYTFQPLYKLTKNDLKIWMNKVEEFVLAGNVNVYAENALNEVSDKLDIFPISYEKYYINEIDNVDDYEKVSSEIRNLDFKEQEIIKSINNLPIILNKYDLHNPLVVVSKFLKTKIEKLLHSHNINYALFDDFDANPKYEEVENALKLFKDNNCDSIVSLGGGSAIDVAKCVKLFSAMDENKNYLTQEHKYINLKHIAIPTTAGTGSESTHFAVIYFEGKKKSVHDDIILPDIAILDYHLLLSLPLYQKKSTLLDALCQAIESIWSVNSNAQSKTYAKKAIKLILENENGYLNGDVKSSKKMIEASNLAGKAINITKTTAAHAMSYKLTSVYGFAHGHAVALALPKTWHYLVSNYKNTFDVRGKKYLRNSLGLINKSFVCQNDQESIAKFISLLHKYDFIKPLEYNENRLNEIVDAINVERLKNFPVSVSKETLKEMYLEILGANY